ncbi:putative spermidine/putrescine transport system substrate-binding protein [Nocardioides marinisabuli]|uniref:Putative spermidine/putrescine transport system substrate-binding protein n=1 Tax=Nocardioides marinisabuli TaxID=419476 RepID=A0A7Y9F300_9ACTN|nr:extracellular solute-binding protein [Nocardioides marinisabuli]NYD58594.1 putative spermidine/putrescine transport system substrate-binding protein [Nocardioides marinisabuli]
MAVTVLTACGAGDDDKTTEAVEELGEMEGQVSILAWPGYVEDGSNDPDVDWVSAFEEETGCQVTSKVYGTSDEALNLAKSGEYDVIAASGDLSLRLISSGEAQEVNTDLVPNYDQVFDFLKDSEWNTLDGVNYGVPHGYGANLLMYNEKSFDTAPTSWGAVFEEEELERNAGKVTAYDSPIYIADAALYLMKTQPELGIENPYALDQEQLDASVELLKQQREYVGEYWSDYLKEIQAFETGDSVVGTTWQVIKNNISNKDVAVTLPEEGATAWNDTWMLSSQAENPNCSYAWMDYILSPEANAQATEYFGEAPNSPAACEETTNPEHCDIFHAGDEEYAEQLWFWRTPIKDCLDGRDVECTDYADWTQAWTEIKG